MTVRPTRFGIKGAIFCGILWCAFYAAPYLNLFFLLLSFLSVFFFWNFLQAWRNLHGVEGRVTEIPPQPAGAQGIFRTTIQTRGRRFDLDVDLQIEGVQLDRGWHRHLAWCLETNGQKVLEGQLPALPRGIYEVTGARITSAHPFGTLRGLKSIATPREIVVYPTPADLSAFRDRSDLLRSLGDQGGEQVLERGPSGLREYKPGDEMRDVHWKASARSAGQLVVREYEGDTAPGLEIQLDLRCANDPLEDSLALISALALDAQTHKDLLTLVTQDHRGTYGKGHEPFQKLWHYLAGVQPLPTDGPAPPATAHGALRLPARQFSEATR